jgi:hypothetical protein
MEGLSQDYLDRITRSVGGTVAKPAQPNVRSDAASQNEAATAVAGAGPGVPAWKAACHIDKAKDGCWNIHSPSRLHYYLTTNGWMKYPHNQDYDIHKVGSYSGLLQAEYLLAGLTTCPPDWPTPAHADDPREEPERFDEATGPMPEAFTTRTDPMPGSPYARKITKPCESIERLVDRLAKVNGAIEVSHGMQYRVTGQVEKAEPRTHDEPGYPEHFALHHVYLPEDWTRGILNAIAYDLAGKLDTGTIRTVLESASRALLLTGELDEADLLGLAVAVEDKLDIGK